MLMIHKYLAGRRYNPLKTSRDSNCQMNTSWSSATLLPRCPLLHCRALSLLGALFLCDFLDSGSQCIWSMQSSACDDCRRAAAAGRLSSLCMAAFMQLGAIRYMNGMPETSRFMIFGHIRRVSTQCNLHTCLQYLVICSLDAPLSRSHLAHSDCSCSTAEVYFAPHYLCSGLSVKYYDVQACRL